MDFMITNIIIFWDDLLYKIYNIIAKILFIIRYPKLKSILKRNTKFLNLHKNQTAVLLLNGPSALNHNLEKLFSDRTKNNNYKIFVVNNFAKNDFQFEAIPDYYLATDSDFFSKEKKAKSNLESILVKYNINTKFIFNIRYLQYYNLTESIHVLYCKHMPTKNSVKSNISTFCSIFFNVSNYALNIISYMGFKRVLVLGLDFDPDWVHFTKEDYTLNINEPSIDKTLGGLWQYYSSVRQSYIVASKLQKMGIDVTNLNPRSKINSFTKSNEEVTDILKIL